MHLSLITLHTISLPVKVCILIKAASASYSPTARAAQKDWPGDAAETHGRHFDGEATLKKVLQCLYVCPNITPPNNYTAAKLMKCGIYCIDSIALT